MKTFVKDGHRYLECPMAESNLVSLRDDWRGHYGTLEQRAQVCTSCGVSLVLMGQVDDQWPIFALREIVIHELPSLVL